MYLKKAIRLGIGAGLIAGGVIGIFLMVALSMGVFK